MTETQPIPFYPGGPVDPSDFSGRKETLLRMAFAISNCDNVLIYGEQYIGKTSLLQYFANPIAASDLKLDIFNIIVYFDVKDCTADVWKKIAVAIAEKIRERVSAKLSGAKQYIDRIENAISSEIGSKSFGSAFEEAFSLLYEIGYKIHILFDDFGHSDLGTAFCNELNKLRKNFKNISYVIASRTELIKLNNSADLFSTFIPITLEPFRKQDVYSFIYDYYGISDSGIKFAEKLRSELKFLRDKTGYHPYFLQILCYYLFTSSKGSDWENTKKDALQSFNHHSKIAFEFYWDHSSEKEQEIIKNFADGDWDRVENRAWFNRLKERFLIIQDDESENGWKLFSDVFRDWVMKQEYLVINSHSKNPPYSNRKMIKIAEDFYDRYRELNEIFYLLQNVQAQNISIVGSLRIGKSSLLYCLKLKEIQKKYNVYDSLSTTRFVYLTLNESRFSKPEKFYSILIKEIYKELNYKGNDIPLELSYDEFYIKITEIQKGIDKLVILLDEFDSLADKERNFDRSFFDNLRALCHSYNIAFITASQINISKLPFHENIIASPFLIFSNHYTYASYLMTR